jgi:DNA-binding CsgD family transcriptional regulator
LTAIALDNLASIAYLRHEYGRATALVYEALALQRAVASISWGTVLSLRILAAIDVVLGAHKRAASLAGEGLAIAWQLRAGWMVAACFTHLACAVAGCGQPARTAWLLGAEAAVLAATGAVRGVVEKTGYERVVAAVRAEMGDAAFAAAWAAGAALPTGDAVAEAMTVVAALSDAVATQGPHATATGHGLTPREVDVLRLLVEGRSNAEIAGALFVSVRTVRGHVANILAKLGVATRTAAATHAVRHGLV